MLPLITIYSARKKPPKIKTKQSTKGGAKQSFKKECDINEIMKKYQKTGAVAHFNKMSARYEDVSPIDFKQAMDTITSTQQMFEALPSTLRNKFHEDPAEFLDFVQDDKNKQEMISLGMIDERPGSIPAKQGAEGDPGAAAAAPETPSTEGSA